MERTTQAGTEKAQVNPTDMHDKGKWRRLSSDFAQRRVEGIEDALGKLTPGRKQVVRSYYYRMAILKRKMEDSEWKEWSKNNKPAEVDKLLEKEL